MKNPNLRQLPEKTVQYWMELPYAVNTYIKSLKKDIAEGDDTRGKRNALAQWKYIAYRIEKLNKVKVVFT